MKIIASATEFQKVKHFIEDIYARNGQIFEQSYVSLEINFRIKPMGDFYVFVDQDNLLVCAFERSGNNIWQSTIQHFPFLYAHEVSVDVIDAFLAEIKDFLNASSLYLPLIYETYGLSSEILKISNGLKWDRLPTQIISGDYIIEEVWEQVESVYGSRSRRQKKKFERDLQVSEIDAQATDTIDIIIKTVETNSWKSQAKQDMMTRDNQFEYYSSLIKSGAAKLTAAFHDQRPIAFIITAQVNGVLYAIKWSYDDNYSKYSPGFYLLVVDVINKYANKNLKYIDLFGSPDQLKDMIQNGSVKRYDFCYDHSINAEELMSKRQRFDTKVKDNYESKNSIRDIYIL